MGCYFPFFLADSPWFFLIIPLNSLFLLASLLDGMKRFIFLFFMFSSSAFAKVSYNMIVDHNFSPFAGGEDLLTAHKIIESLEDATTYPTKNPSTGALAVFWRLAELGLFWDPLNRIISTTQHEVFGHGYRIREMSSAHVKKYEINWPYPYSFNGIAGETVFTFDAKKATAAEMISITIGGFDAQEILAYQLKMKWLATHQVDPRAAELYINSQQTLFLYATAAVKDKMEVETKNLNEDLFSCNDIQSYIRWLNLLYPNDKLTLSKIKTQSLLNLLDPFSIFSAYSWWHFVFTGKSMPLPTLHAGRFTYLPGFKVSLAPYGLEYYFENFFALQDRPFYFYIKGGEHGKTGYWGAGFEMEQLCAWSGGTFGLKIDIWRQPQFLQPIRIASVINNPSIAASSALSKVDFGAAGSMIFRWQLGSGKFFYLYTEGGYKTKGYLPGYSLTRSVIWRVGLTTNF